ncbi:AI-2E family transporter [Luteitalea sp. TBR-22]|uniref:AI-2E family transporter n=1 Tax=Luteitalea sp. TBR-22 TaxID=2802971 RepID=UPI001AFAD85F|nr:AI-2E family transporter [Luteitalea sp. TBR-22]BCS31164.1 AI-2E family transporter [Luteitalea sp. TBR-22]
MRDFAVAPRQRPLLYGLVLLGVYLSWLVLGTFVVALTWAAVLAVLFSGVQQRLAARIGPARAALATTTLAGAAVLLPTGLFLSALATELPHAATYLQQTGSDAPRHVREAWGAIRTRVPVALPENPTALLGDAAHRAIALLAPRVGSLAADAVATIGDLLAMLFALFFLLRDGDMLARRLQDVLPMRRTDSERLMRETREMVVASVGAGAIVALAQGTIGGVAFWALSIGPPLFWGCVLAFASLLPVVGAALVWVPIGVVLVITGEVWRGVALLLVGSLGISMADNVLRPWLLSGRTQINGLVIFFGLLGGVAAFGFIGLVIGPIILVRTHTLLGIARRPALRDDVA